MKKYEKIEENKYKILQNAYFNEANRVYTKNYMKVKISEKRRSKCQETLVDFLEKNLSSNNYERAKKYIDELSKQSNEITSVWNQIFYFAGLENRPNLFLDGR